MSKIIIFTMPTCAPCKVVKRWVTELGIEDVTYYNCDEDEDFFVEKYAIKSVPTTIIFDDNMNELRRNVGNFQGDRDNFSNFINA